VDGTRVGTTPWSGERPPGRYVVELVHASGRTERVLDVGAERAALCWDLAANAVCPR